MFCHEGFGRNHAFHANRIYIVSVFGSSRVKLEHIQMSKVRANSRKITKWENTDKRTTTELTTSYDADWLTETNTSSIDLREQNFEDEADNL